MDTTPKKYPIMAPIIPIAPCYNQFLVLKNLVFLGLNKCY